MLHVGKVRLSRRRAPANDTLSLVNAIASSAISNSNHTAADPLTQYGEAVMSAGRTDQCGEHKCDGDKHNNQSNDDYHVDTSDSDSILH
jgi:uncharacterized low-complexity protein